RGIAAALGADEVGTRTLRPDLELLLGGGTERVGSRDDDRVSVLRQLGRELADRRRLAGAVDADDENHARRSAHVQRAGISEERRDLVGESFAEIAELAARLEPLDELCRRADADIGLDQRLLEPLPGQVITGVERSRLDLLGERAARLRERVAQSREHA